jgi:hypothetical protein
MDLIIKLLKLEEYNLILVIINRIIKYIYFILIIEKMNILLLAKILL